MPDITFDATGYARFVTRHHGEVTLSKVKWDKVCVEPERHYYRFNGDKVGTTLINPDAVRASSLYPNQFNYYKRFPSVHLSAFVEVPTLPGGFPCPYFCVVIDDSTKRVCTTYPVAKPKPGKDI